MFQLHNTPECKCIAPKHLTPRACEGTYGRFTRCCGGQSAWLLSLGNSPLVVLNPCTPWVNRPTRCPPLFCLTIELRSPNPCNHATLLPKTPLILVSISQRHFGGGLDCDAIENNTAVLRASASMCMGCMGICLCIRLYLMCVYSYNFVHAFYVFFFVFVIIFLYFVFI